jgi:putative hydrolase of the HAD superfamily
MTTSIELVLFDIGGVLGSNGWDREQRTAAIERFGLDAEDFQYRHEETIGAVEVGQMSLDEYLRITAYCGDATASCANLKAFMFEQSVPWPDSITVARELAESGLVRMATLNNEGEELNLYRIRTFGLHDIFPSFFTSCWLRVRKPMHEIYERVLKITQANHEQTLFIDDRLQNLAPATALGMKTIQFQSAAQLRRDLQQYGLLP